MYDPKLRSYTDLTVRRRLRYTAWSLVSDAMGRIDRAAPGSGQALSLLALRRYLRIQELDLTDLASIWSWTSEEMRESATSANGLGRRLMNEAALVQQAFARVNPGYTLGISPPRELERQVELWTDNGAIRIEAERLFREAKRLISQPALEPAMRARWLIIAALACTRRETAESVKPEAELAAAQPHKEPSPADDVVVASRWLDALRDNDQKELTGLTRYPFELHDPDGTCTDQAALNPEGLPKALACLTGDGDLIGLLRSHESSDIEPLDDIHLSAWEKRWHVTPPPKRVITASFARSDSRVELDIAIADGGVRGVWKTGVAGSWAVKLASEWVDAVRHRDLERLEGVTAYPFELRDTRRGASCGNRWAKARADLPKAVECLFQNDELQRR